MSSWSRAFRLPALVVPALLGPAALLAGSLRADEPPSPVEPTVPVDVAAASASSPALDALASLGFMPVHASVVRGTLVYAAPTTGGIVVIDLADSRAPRVVGRLLEGRLVTRLFVDDERLWAIVVSEEALAFSLATPQAPSPTLAGSSLVGIAPAPAVVAGTVPGVVVEPTRAAAALPTARVKVRAVTEGRVIFEGGSDDGFQKGMRVRVIAQRLVKKPALDATDHRSTVDVPSGEVTAVVAIEEISAHSAMAVLGRGDVAMPGDLVEATTADLSEKLFLPSRAPFSWRVGFHVRPFLGLGTSGFPVGALVDGWAQYTFEGIPLALSAEVAPVGFAVFSKDLHYPTTLVLGASYVTDWFEVGLGGGALVGNKGPCTIEFDPQTGSSTGTETCEENTGPTFNQMLRLGAVDGIHLRWSSSIFARSGGFVLGVGRGEINVPVSSRFGLFAGGGGGENGWAYGELGVRTLFGGTGAPGTTILSTSLGYAGVFDGPGERVVEAGTGVLLARNREIITGPSVAVGVEWRW